MEQYYENKIIKKFKSFFNKKTDKDTKNLVDYQEIKDILKDALLGVKDLGFSIKFTNSSFEPITYDNLSISIRIRPEQPSYDLNELLSEVKNSVSHIENNNMSVENRFTVPVNYINSMKLYSQLVEFYPNLIVKQEWERAAIELFKNIENFKNFINNSKIDPEAINIAKMSVYIELTITGKV